MQFLQQATGSLLAFTGLCASWVTGCRMMWLLSAFPILPFLHLLDPPLSSVTQPSFEMGQLARYLITGPYRKQKYPGRFRNQGAYILILLSENRQ